MDQDIGRVAGLGPGAMVMTTDGELPVEWLESGDRVITRDHGAQPILWIDRWKRVDPGGVDLPRPLRLVPDMGSSQDSLIEPLRLAPQHRVMVRSADVELHFGAPEVIAEIGHLSRLQEPDGDDTCETVTYHNLILPRHALIWACGIWIESAAPDIADRLEVPLSVRARSAIFAPQNATVRPCLHRNEARMIRKLLMPHQSMMALLAA